MGRDGMNATAGGAARSPEGVALISLLLFTLMALVGYGVFGLRPHQLPDIGAVVAFWRVSFQFFAQLHIVLGAVVLGVLLVRYAGMRWLPAFIAVYVISFLSEYFGTGYGIPFGNYEYTSLLGWKIDDRVPWVIPLSWFLMAVPSYALARVTFPGRAGRWPRILFAGVILTLWDLALDPAMSYQSPYYWRWSDMGPYYGMPWVNLAGWVATGWVLMAAIEFLGGEGWVAPLSVRWLSGYYAVTLLMPFGMLILEGLWLAAVVTVIGYAVAMAFHAWVVGRRGAPAERRLVREPVGEGA